MKTSQIRLLSLLLAVVPLMAAAQSNIKSAFDAIIKCPQAQISESHTLDKDPSTGMKTGQSDEYLFSLPATKGKLIDKVLEAFDKDIEMAYSVKRGKSTRYENEIGLAIGNGENSVLINSPESEYIYSLFLAPQAEDPDGIHRYGYAMSFKEERGKLVGKLVVTYATTLKYRQELAQKQQYNVLRNLSNGTYVINGNTDQQLRFDDVMGYLQAMDSANSKRRITYARNAYKVIRNVSKYSDVTEGDKEAIRVILKAMIADKKYSETVLNRLLQQCLAGIQ